MNTGLMNTGLMDTGLKPTGLKPTGLMPPEGGTPAATSASTTVRSEEGLETKESPRSIAHVMSPSDLDLRSQALRWRLFQMLEAGRRGHIGAALSLIEILRVLFDDVMRYDPQRPDWRERDRFILSKGHGCLALYLFLAEKGFFPEAELWKFCKETGILGGHPERGRVPGVEASTGSLGHGLPIGVGFAIHARYEKLPSRVFVVVGDGECNEGSVWEAALCAAKHKLDNLVVLVDYNKMQSSGYTRDVMDLEPFAAKWTSFGFQTLEVDGHDVVALRKVLQAIPLQAGRPTAIICHTIKGRGLAWLEEDLNWHHKSSLNDADLSQLKRALEATCARPA